PQHGNGSVTLIEYHTVGARNLIVTKSRGSHPIIAQAPGILTFPHFAFVDPSPNGRRSNTFKFFKRNIGNVNVNQFVRLQINHTLVFQQQLGNTSGSFIVARAAFDSFQGNGHSTATGNSGLQGGPHGSRIKDISSQIAAPIDTSHYPVRLLWDQML